MERVTHDAASRSSSARTSVERLIEEALQQIADDPAMPTEIKRMGVSELFALLEWEFKRLPLTHNAPLKDAAKINDDTKMMTTLTNGYLQNVAQRYLLGVESKKNLINEGSIMVEYLGCTPFAVEDQPTLREANSRIFYLANNLGKTDAGNFQYGEVTYVIHPSALGPLTYLGSLCSLAF